MATTKSVQYTLASIANPSRPLKPNEHTGRNRVAFAEYTITAADVNGGVINLFKLPKGARLGSGVIVWDDMGTSVTFDIGDPLDADRLLAAADVAAAASKAIIGERTAALFGYELTVDSIISVTIGGATPTGTPSFKVWLNWSLD